jgi:hypothetical protein
MLHSHKNGRRPPHTVPRLGALFHIHFLIGAHSCSCDSAHADSPTRSQGIGLIVKYGACAANKGAMPSCLLSGRRLRQVGLNLYGKLGTMGPSKLTSAFKVRMRRQQSVAVHRSFVCQPDIV